MIFCITLKKPRVPCRQSIMLHCMLMTENGKDLSTDWKTQIFGHTVFTPLSSYPSSSVVGSSGLRRDSPQVALPLWPCLQVLLTVDLRKVLHDQRGSDKNQVFLQVVSGCSACLLQRTCPPWSVHPWVVLTPPHQVVVVPPGFPSPSLFPQVPVSSFLRLLCLLPPRQWEQGTAHSSKRYPLISLTLLWGTLDSSGPNSASHILYNDQTQVQWCTLLPKWYFTDSRITFKLMPPVKRLISDLDFH